MIRLANPTHSQTDCAQQSLNAISSLQWFCERILWKNGGQSKDRVLTIINARHKTNYQFIMIFDESRNAVRLWAQASWSSGFANPWCKNKNKIIIAELLNGFHTYEHLTNNYSRNEKWGLFEFGVWHLLIPNLKTKMLNAITLWAHNFGFRVFGNKITPRTFKQINSE
jgi:hypothetical protein